MRLNLRHDVGPPLHPYICMPLSLTTSLYRSPHYPRVIDMEYLIENFEKPFKRLKVLEEPL